MTGQVVEREKRTACRSSAITHGSSPLMPSHSQGAERRPERRARHTGSRWYPRALDVDVTVAELEPTVGGLLKAAVQPPESVPRNHPATASPRTSREKVGDRDGTRTGARLSGSFRPPGRRREAATGHARR
jgi:hypothetical protein